MNSDLQTILRKADWIGFDLDDTLVKTTEDNELRKQRGLVVLQEHYPAESGAQIEARYSVFYETMANRSGLALQELGLTASALEQLTTAFYASQPELREGAYELLDLVGERGFLLTNGTTANQTKKIEATGLKAYFGGRTFISQQIGLSKPNPDAFKYVLEKINANPANAVYFGDNPKTDMKGAIEAGLTAVRVRFGKRASLPPGAESAEITNLSEITLALPRRYSPSKN